MNAFKWSPQKNRNTETKMSARNDNESAFAVDFWAAGVEELELGLAAVVAEGVAAVVAEGVAAVVAEGVAAVVAEGLAVVAGAVVAGVA
jgi:hypothetical protein